MKSGATVRTGRQYSGIFSRSIDGVVKLKKISSQIARPSVVFLYCRIDQPFAFPTIKSATVHAEFSRSLTFIVSSTRINIRIFASHTHLVYFFSAVAIANKITPLIFVTATVVYQCREVSSGVENIKKIAMQNRI